MAGLSLMGRCFAGVVVIIVSIAGLVSCAAAEGVRVRSTELTWQEAKSQTQNVELEIADLIPAVAVVNVEQQSEGGLFACRKDQHSWGGSTTVTVVSNVDIDQIVKDIEKHYQDDSRFVTRNRLNIGGSYEVQLMSPDTAESYIIAGNGLDSIRIASSSPCFTLPEGTYPGGNF